MFCEYENKKANFDQFEDVPLTNFGISDKTHLDSMLKTFSDAFKKANEQ